jgi:hypothetical protein
MRPSEGMPGVILEGKECRRVRVELEAYPISVTFGQDPAIRRAIERMDMIKNAVGRLVNFTLETDTAEKLATHIEESWHAEQAEVNDRLTRQFLNDANCVPYYDYLRLAQRLKFARNLRKHAALSRRLAPEQMQPEL